MINKIAICGSGTMGAGIAQAAAQSGYLVILYDMDKVSVEKAASSIQKNLRSLVEKQKLDATEETEIFNRIRFSSELSDCRGDLVVEAIVEKLDAKRELLRSIAALNAPQTILCTNTSSLSVTAVFEGIDEPTRAAGLHFFNPATIMKLVEIVRTEQTSDDTIEQLKEVCLKMNKTPVLCKDAPGFIVNHVARPYYLEALRLVELGASDFETIDKLLESSGFKMGPFRLMDLIGNDINYAVSCSVYEALGKPDRLRPSIIQEEKVRSNELGRKSGKGYYSY